MRNNTAAVSDNLLYSSRDAARLLAISTRKLYDLTASGQLPAIRIGRAVRYAMEDLRRYIDAQRGAAQ